jgi:hypothetical protein
MRPFSLFLVACAIFFLADSIKPVSGYDVHQFTAKDKTGKINIAWDRLAEERHVSREVIIERVQDTMHRVSTGAQIFNALAMAGVLALLFRKRFFVGTWCSHCISCRLLFLVH